MTVQCCANVLLRSSGNSIQGVSQVALIYKPNESCSIAEVGELTNAFRCYSADY